MQVAYDKSYWNQEYEMQLFSEKVKMELWETK